jgi:hypothetical protein
MFQPSVVLPGPETDGYRIMLWNSNLEAYSNKSQAIFAAVDMRNTMQFPYPVPVLQMSCGICDMMCARPVWDGELWHVFVQARLSDKHGMCPPTGHLVQAIGPSLFTLRWDTDDSGGVRILARGTGDGAGIGEDLQAFIYEGKLVVAYNDWGQGIQLCWSDGPVSTPAVDPWIVSQGYTDTVIFPDAILEGTDILIGAQSSAYRAKPGYQYSRVFGLFHWHGDGAAIGLALRSMQSDQYGERMFRPRFARDGRGFIPRTGENMWDFIVIYNPTRVDTDVINGYSRWNTSDQGLAFSTGRIEKL